MNEAERFDLYLDHLSGGLGHADRHAGLRGCCTVLMLPLSRKSVEPMAAPVDPMHASARHQSLHHFVAKAEWSSGAGRTFGRSGFGNGPCTVWPLLGPSSLRDSFALPLDRRISPALLVSDSQSQWALYGLQVRSASGCCNWPRRMYCCWTTGAWLASTARPVQTCWKSLTTEPPTRPPSSPVNCPSTIGMPGSATPPSPTPYWTARCSAITASP